VFGFQDPFAEMLDFSPFTEVSFPAPCRRFTKTERLHKAMVRKIEDLNKHDDFVKRKAKHLEDELKRMKEFQDQADAERDEVLKKIEELEKSLEEERASKRMKVSDKENDQESSNTSSVETSKVRKQNDFNHQGSFRMFRKHFSTENGKSQESSRMESKTVQKLEDGSTRIEHVRELDGVRVKEVTVRPAEGSEEAKTTTTKELTANMTPLSLPESEGAAETTKANNNACSQEEQLERFERMWKGNSDPSEETAKKAEEKEDDKPQHKQTETASHSPAPGLMEE